MSIEIDDGNVGVAVHQPFQISVLENVRCDKTTEAGMEVSILSERGPKTSMPTIVPAKAAEGKTVP